MLCRRTKNKQTKKARKQNKNKNKPNNNNKQNKNNKYKTTFWQYVIGKLLFKFMFISWKVIRAMHICEEANENVTDKYINASKFIDIYNVLGKTLDV
jgi:hypothetical protein